MVVWVVVVGAISGTVSAAAAAVVVVCDGDDGVFVLVTVFVVVCSK